MKLFDLVKTFKADEDGAVTVDWVVLTAAIVGLGIVVMASVRTGTEGLANKIGSELSKMEVGSSTAGGNSTGT